MLPQQGKKRVVFPERDRRRFRKQSEGIMERARRQDPSGPSLEALTAEWREHALLAVDRELDVIRGVLSRADNGFRFGNVTIAVFDVAAKKVPSSHARRRRAMRSRR